MVCRPPVCLVNKTNDERESIELNSFIEFAELKEFAENVSKQYVEAMFLKTKQTIIQLERRSLLQPGTLYEIIL